MSAEIKPITMLPMWRCNPKPGDKALLYVVDFGYYVGTFYEMTSGVRQDKTKWCSPARWIFSSYPSDLDSVVPGDPSLIGWLPLSGSPTIVDIPET